MSTIKRFFNMIEITLAIAVIGIGMAGVMSLFPLAINSSRDSIGDNYAPDIATMFLSYMSVELQKPPPTDWWTTTLNGIPSTKAAAGDEGTWAPPIAIGLTTTMSSGPANKGLYRITQGSSSVTDFDAVARVWKDDIKDVYVNWSNVSNVGQQYGVALYVEVSWPTAKPYDKRDKRTYYLEIYNERL